MPQCVHIGVVVKLFSVYAHVQVCTKASQWRILVHNAYQERYTYT